MRFLGRLLIGGDERVEQRNMGWNMAGSFLYALASMVLTIAVVQLVGEDEGGIFSFAFRPSGSICSWPPISGCARFRSRIREDGIRSGNTWGCAL